MLIGTPFVGVDKETGVPSNIIATECRRQPARSPGGGEAAAAALHVAAARLAAPYARIVRFRR